MRDPKKRKRTLIDEAAKELARLRRAQPPGELFDQAAAAQAANEANRVLDIAVKAREQNWHDERAWSLWKEAARLCREAGAAAFPPGLWEAIDGFRAGDPSGLDVAVRFLEDDPWFDNSGYAKEDILRFLKRVDIPEEYAHRLRKLALAVVDRYWRRDLAYYCRLMRKMETSELRAALNERLGNPDDGVRKRARRMLDVLDSQRPKRDQS